jgi:hypothetical protein
VVEWGPGEGTELGVQGVTRPGGVEVRVGVTLGGWGMATWRGCWVVGDGIMGGGPGARHGDGSLGGTESGGGEWTRRTRWAGDSMRMRSRRGGWGRIFFSSKHLRHRRVRKTRFIKRNMPRNYNAS